MDTLSNDELQHRLLFDYNKSATDVRAELQALLPEHPKAFLEQLMTSKHLDHRHIAGAERYFRSAVRNVFRLDKTLHPLRNALGLNTGAWRTAWTKRCLPSLVSSLDNAVSMPQTNEFEWHFTLTVKPDVVPDGETIRCWLPLPNTIVPYQQADEHIVTSVANPIVSGNRSAHSTVYLEQKALAGQPTVFSVKQRVRLSTEVHNFSQVDDCRSTTNENLTPYLEERPPHIVFSKLLKELSAEIVNPLHTPWEKVCDIFSWISREIPWVSAREYATIDNIPEHVLQQMGGDCGEKTLLFIALCRLNGIAARWQSGFMLHTRHQNLHDWAEIYHPTFGWVAVDVSFGLQTHLPNLPLRQFYLGNRDGYHLVVNSDFGAELFPKKQFPRSETVDFQRGEVEWRGGNLYFDQWHYTFKAVRKQH
ncbi:MAG: transglutaminase-like domain-containing protein [Bacteroidales bacterium]|nr:transglutaminase-like domain-containing protein [Bacteroidales bacterium]